MNPIPVLWYRVARFRFYFMLLYVLLGRKAKKYKARKHYRKQVRKWNRRTGKTFREFLATEYSGNFIEGMIADQWDVTFGDPCDPACIK